MSGVDAPTITIRRAGVPADLDTVRALFLEYARSLDFALCFQGFDEELATLPGAYGPPSGALLLAGDSTGALGCVALRSLGASVCEMKRFYVRPEARGMGLGRSLVTRIITEARALRYERMRLDTVPSMLAAQALYRQLGFRPIEAYCANPIPGTVWMELDLQAPARRGQHRPS